MTPKCDLCSRTMEPTIALRFWYRDLKADPDLFPWACRYCKVVSTESEPVQPSD